MKDFKGNSPYLIYYTLKNMSLESFNSGAGVPSLNRNHLSALKIYIPDCETQKMFDRQIKPIFEKANILERAVENLNLTKEKLLPRLISGKLSAEDLDIQFPPSMQEDSAA